MNNADLLDLAIKQKLIGATIHFADNTTKIIADFELNSAIDQICIKCTDGDYKRLNFREKFKVETIDVVERINKGKVKMHKK